MNRLVCGAVALAFALVTPAVAKPHGYHVVHSNSYVTGEGGYYTNVNGHHVHRPVGGSSRPAGATARCGDGSWSFSENHRGTCSHHGGVSSWL